jgi:hypothetical protein
MKNTQAHVCTDGSTYPGKPSAAALVYVSHDITSNELWGTKGTYWKLPRSDNYIAEMSAINKALRSLPVDLNVVIWTDSLSSIQAIDRHMRGLSNLLREAARPYLIAIKRIIAIRTFHGSSSDINHVKSHTGERDLPSIGNAEADRLAKYEALSELNEGDNGNDLHHLQNDLPFMVSQITAVPSVIVSRKRKNIAPNKTGTKNNLNDSTHDKKALTLFHYKDIHGDIRKTLKTSAHESQLDTWAERPTRGQLIRNYRKEITHTIKDLWKNPSSSNIKFFIDILNKADKKTLTDTNFITITCVQCSRREKADTDHRLVTCPALADIWNKADSLIWSCLNLDDILHGISTPWGKTEDKITNDICNLYNNRQDHRQFTSVISRCATWMNDPANSAKIIDGSNPIAANTAVSVAASVSAEAVTTSSSNDAFYVPAPSDNHDNSAGPAPSLTAENISNCRNKKRGHNDDTFDARARNNNNTENSNLEINSNKKPRANPQFTEPELTKNSPQDKRQRKMTDIWLGPARPILYSDKSCPKTASFRDTEHLVHHYLKGTITKSQQAWNNCDFLYDIAAKFLHTENILNTDALNYSGETHWFSSDPTELSLGAKGNDPATYLNGNYTWINLCDETKTNTHSDNCTLDQIKPNTRMVILTYNNLELTNTHGMAARTLVTFPPFSIEIKERICLPPKPDQTRTNSLKRNKRKSIANALRQAAAKLIQFSYRSYKAKHPTSSSNKGVRTILRHRYKAKLDLFYSMYDKFIDLPDTIQDWIKNQASILNIKDYENPRRVLATLITLFKKLRGDSANWEEKTRRSTLNDRRIYLHLLNNKTPHDIDLKAFHEALATHKNSSRFVLNIKDKQLADAGLVHNSRPHTQKRARGNFRPSLIWHRHTLHHKSDKHQDTIDQINGTDTLAAALGFSPNSKTIRKFLSICDHHPSTLSSSILTKINKILLKAAQIAYARQEKWERIIRND